MRQKTDIRDLYLVGQWVFPGFGVAGVMASGYYLAKEILKGEGIDLKKEFTECFSGRWMLEYKIVQEENTRWILVDGHHGNL